MSKYNQYNPRMRNMVGNELAHLPQRTILPPIPNKDVAYQEGISLERRYVVDIPESPTLLRFGTCGPEFTQNLDSLLD